jgi:ABC-2 type transport system permease protein
MTSTAESPVAPRHSSSPASVQLPGALGVGMGRIRIELLSYLRSRQAVVFTFALPIVLLLLFGAIFNGPVEDTGVSIQQVLIAGIIAAGIMSTTFSSLAVGIAVERDDGTLLRLAATPMPKAAYFIGKLGLAVVTGVVETIVLLALGVGLYGLALPATPERWLTLLWVVGLGIVSCSLLGIAYSSAARSARSAAAVVQLPYLTLQLISGVFFVFTALPIYLQTVAAIFPLKWMAQGLRSVFLPDAFQKAEAAGNWEPGRTALVLGLWCVTGFVLCIATFRWNRASRR